MKLLVRFLKGLGVLSLFVLVAACSSDSKKADTPEGAFEIAQDYEKNDRYEEAIRRYQEVRNRFPYSKFATLAELAVADVYFKQESFAEAQVSYQNFRELHPKHLQIDYVIFRTGLSIFNQLPSTIDRDLSVAESAISYFSELIQLFPKSTFVKEAQEKKRDVLDRLAQKELYIADFYYKKKFYDSAERRYQSTLSRYPGLGYDARALKGWGLALVAQGQKQKAEVLLERLKKEHANSSELRELKAVMQK